MRIVAGKYRHRNIIYPDDASIRPTKDRIREALFSALGDISNLSVLDLYAGSGAMGIETLSRGASKCVFVDKYQVAIKTIKANISNLDIENAEVIFDTDTNALELFKNKGYKFDIVILDPPYKSETYIDVINYLINNNLVTEHARIITECDRALDFSSIKVERKKEYHYGEININILYL